MIIILLRAFHSRRFSTLLAKTSVCPTWTLFSTVSAESSEILSKCDLALAQTPPVLMYDALIKVLNTLFTASTIPNQAVSKNITIIQPRRNRAISFEPSNIAISHVLQRCALILISSIVNEWICCHILIASQQSALFKGTVEPTARPAGLR